MAPTVTYETTEATLSFSTSATQVTFNTRLREVRTDVYFNCGYGNHSQKEETSKERIKRIAKEKMYASWKTYNERKITIKEVKQICKPTHKINHSGRRF